jgi:voltage-gated potassium channel
MAVPRIEHVEVKRLCTTSRRGSRLWREWCFARVAFRHFRVRFIVMAAILLGGGAMFVWLEPEKHHSLGRGVYYAWSLIFGEAPEAFPAHLALRAMFFVMPVLGLTVIIEGIIDFALMLRDRRRYERSWCTMLAKSYTGHIILVGFGKLGYRIFHLLRKLDEPVVVIERNATNEFLEELRRDGSPLLIGDARREALLEEANVAHAKSIILATDDDLANLEIALDAQKLSPDIRIVMRMFDQNMADKTSSGFNIDLAMSQAALAAPTFATSAVAPAIVSSFIVGKNLIAMQRWLVRRGGPLDGMSVGDVTAALGFGVVEHQRPPQEPRLFPTHDTVLQPGDGLILQGPLDELADLWQENVKNAAGTKA